MNKITSIPPDIPKQISDNEGESQRIKNTTTHEFISSQPNKPNETLKKRQDPILTAADGVLVHRTLMAQEDGLARREDLTELHKRIVKMFQRLAEGLGDSMAKKAAADRAGLTARIDAMEDSINRMEGALRIEFEPVLRNAMADVLAKQDRPKKRPLRTIFRTGAVLAGGLAFGVMYHSELLALTKQIVSHAAAILG